MAKKQRRYSNQSRGDLPRVWTVIVEVEGVQTKLPAQVIATILRHRDTIIKQQRHDRAVAQAEATITKATEGGW
jgi:hypothetical protein